MTRLTQILLASTLLPSLTSFPYASAWSQAPEKGERHNERHHEGAQKGDGRGAQNEEHKRGREGGGAERRDGSHARDENRNEQRPSKAERHDDRGAGRAEHRDDRRPGKDERHDEKRLGKEERRDEGRQGTEEKRNERRLGNEQRRDERKLGTEEKRDERRLGNEQRRDERKLGTEEKRDERRLGNEQRRDERRLGTEEKRDERRLGNEQRRDERKLDNGERRDERRLGTDERRDERRLGPDERRGAPGAAVGFAGGFLPPTNARRIDDLRRERREVREGDRVFIREPGRTIVEERGRSFIVHDETDRFRALGLDVRRERRGDQFVDSVRRPNGDVIITITDGSGRMLRRLRRDPGGREIVLIDNGVGGRVRPYAEDVVVLPPPQIRIPRERYIVDYRDANPTLLYDTLVAPPLAPPPQRYTLDQIRYSPDIRSYVRQVDINTINFESGSWEVPHAADAKLEALASAIKRAVERNPNSIFLIEGYTDATGNPNDNLSLSDRRAQSVAEILSKEFSVPPENLTTQGYGQQNLKEETQGPSAANRRVVVRNITQLLAAGGSPAGH